jgi:murein DD-endopeptidase MepM/ murein hydrolase activator NlpD
VRYEYGLPIDSFRIDTCVVKSGETLGGMLNRLGATRQQVAGVTMIPRSEFDVRSILPGKTYYALFQADTAGIEQLCHYIYKTNIRETFVVHLKDIIYAVRLEKPIIRYDRAAEVVIESSLWNAMVGNNLPPEVAIELSDIYAWTIDFFGLQKGDSIRVYYEEQYVDSIRIGIGRIYAADFYHGRRWQEAYWFEDGKIHNYFDAEGNSLRKAFLKAPLNYKRISSKFTHARKHPIYKTVRPHTGVDYAAPAGTPVVSIGDGVVTMKQYKGGGGHTVKIKHNSTYTTAYLHLSKYAKGLAVGKRVKQGEVIGYVGSSGASTGPHLDFRVWKNGTPIDPLKMKSPPAEPIPTQYKDTFATVVAEYQEILNTVKSSSN